MSVQPAPLWFFFIYLTPGCALLILGVWRAARPVGLKELKRWARRYSLSLTDATRPLVASYLRRTRSLRLLGAAVGYLVSPLSALVTHQAVPLFGNVLVFSIGGYLAGAALAELGHQASVANGTSIRAASLTPRAVYDYVRPFSMWALRTLPLLTIALAVAYAFAPQPSTRPTDPSVALVVAVSAVMVAIAGGVEFLLRAVAARPQPAINPDLVAADDAVRASSIHALSGATIGLLLVEAGWAAFSLQLMTAVSPPYSASPFYLALGWLGTALVVVAVASWFVLGRPTGWHKRQTARST